MHGVALTSVASDVARKETMPGNHVSFSPLTACSSGLFRVLQGSSGYFRVRFFRVLLGSLGFFWCSFGGGEHPFRPDPRTGRRGERHTSQAWYRGRGRSS